MEKIIGNIQYMLEHLSRLLNTGIFLVQDEEVFSYQEDASHNPLYVNKGLQDFLIEHADLQKEPYIWKDEHHVFFSCIYSEQGYYLVGPMSTEVFNHAGRHRFYRDYGVEESNEKNLWHFTLMQILHVVCVVTNAVSGQEYTDQELVDANHLSPISREEEQEEQIIFTLQSDETDYYRHSYTEERKLLDAVQEGDAEKAVCLSKEMDVKIGRLGPDEVSHWRNVLTVGVALCARAAIMGGLAPVDAYRISGFYINKSTITNNVAQILVFRNHAIEELAKRVKGVHEEKHSGYTEQCKDYIRKHFREKIYLEDIAGTLGISSSYLSKLFKKETGMNIQDYIVSERVERSANLLVYSNETIPMIAQYVNFPSQSYFGKIFKAYKGMTPRQYREKYKTAEFLE